MAKCLATWVALVALVLPAAAHAAFPGQNGRIAITTGMTGVTPTDVYTTDPAGLTELRITDDGVSGNGAFSPDGSQLAFSSGDSIYISDQYGNGRTSILDTDSEVRGLDWSPAGDQLVAGIVVCSDGDCGSDLFTFNTDGSGLTNITNTFLSEEHPAWSMDGSKIAFDCIVSEQYDVYTVNSDGSGTFTNVTAASPLKFAGPDWLPDGSKVALWANSAGSGSGTYTADPDGSDLSHVAGGSGTPVWSPDGARIATYGNSGPVNISSSGAPGSIGLRPAGAPTDWQVRPPDPVPPQRGVEFPRPRSATPLRVPLVLTYAACLPNRPPNRVHGPPLEHPSCTPPQRTSQLTVGTPDSGNGLPAEASGSVRFDSVLGDPSTAADEADVRIRVAQTDVRYQNPASGWPDYPGELLLVAELRQTDFFNGGGGTDGSATMLDFPLRVVVPCSVMPGPEGASCAIDTTMDAVTPGAVRERERTMWELAQIVLEWEGVDGNPTTVKDNFPFVTQGIFVP